MIDDAPSSAVGWYGKLPSLGDFASRRLPPSFVEAWDEWLAAGMASWRERDEAWLEAYLTAPIWRFALGAGVPFAASPGWVGVLMPSVDRVGRYFPLTVARARGAWQIEAPSAWLRDVEDVASAALQDDWTAERVDAELLALDPVDDAGPSWPDAGVSVWWCELDGEVSTPLTSHGLPDAQTLARLLGERTGDDAAAGPVAGAGGLGTPDDLALTGLLGDGAASGAPDDLALAGLLGDGAASGAPNDLALAGLLGDGAAPDRVAPADASDEASLARLLGEHAADDPPPEPAAPGGSPDEQVLARLLGDAPPDDEPLLRQSEP